MRDNEWLYRGRLGRFLEELIVPHQYGETRPLTLTAWPVPDEPVPFAQAVAQDYRPFQVGSTWGKGWSTLWFHVTGEVPERWRADNVPYEIVVDLGFRKELDGSQAEGLAFRPDGTIIKAIEPFNRYLPVEHPEVIDFYLEAAANPEVAVGGSWHPTPFSSKATVPDEPLYVLRTFHLARRNVEVWELHRDLEVLAGLAEELPADLPRRAEIVVALNAAMDAVDPHDVPGTAPAARAALQGVLARPANASAHRIVATGHAHIDSAWLWPVRETVRKCARTFANVIALATDHPDLVFSCSSAQQYAWVKQYYPDLWQRLKDAVAAGTFVPVGGMWVESDTNMPGSEALARQFVYGKRFFLDEFGYEPLDVWLPDSFGYSAALPQVAKASGSRWFLTQKMSWNETNVLPHHTFWWEGIDGTRIFTHLPPVDTYNSTLAAFELAKAQRQYAEQGHGTVSLVPFGYGDGGGGPTREMVARAHRTADLEGSPTVRIATVHDFFSEAEAELEHPHTWSGEMYLETHRGTYTSQHRTKQGNRRSEHLLRAAELWAVTSAVRAGTPYPTDELADCWRTVLLQQFHDILPGSSIAWVHREAEANYARVAETLEAIIDRSLRALAGEGDMSLTVNSAPVALDGVAPFAIQAAPADPAANPASSPHLAVSDAEAGGWLIDTGAVRVVLDAEGLIPSAVHLATGREAVAEGRRFGLLQLHNDRPSMYEAWDIDGHINRMVTDLDGPANVRLVESGDRRAVFEVVRRHRDSTLSYLIAFTAGSAAIDFDFDIDWHEQRTLLKFAFPTSVFTDRAASEIQFGHLHRPTYSNTTWDAARYETVAHRWVQVAEPGFGFAVANDSTYGHDIRRDHAGERSSGTTVRLSLLRGPKFPDPDTDQGRQRLTVSAVVGADIADAIVAGQRLNQPLRALAGAHGVEPLLRCEAHGVLVEAVKLAEDGSGDVVVRLYESLGARAHGRLHAGFGFDSVERTDLLERVLPDAPVEHDDDPVTLALRPFEIVTLRFSGVRA
ncbi:alpha-mannosidase [Micropruina sonneratiae]|uniref:alpha-mannosidase n=1 Tax=Micropruina sonneratiae TaxID=2986940 RepID=UPI002227EBFE|nr:glycoside hydrolase family 38 C-terminal domain-containing protein [Micropruina sp. KQZ13P-5]MCW3158052.1 glycosyl hydrolase-related protein [Micropruina sp. KQZ13P-5]